MCRDFSPTLLDQVLQPHHDACLEARAPVTAVTQLGLMTSLQSEYTDLMETKPLFIYSNCMFNIVDGYDSLQTLEQGGYICDTRILQQVTKSKFRTGGLPRLKLSSVPEDRLQTLRMLIQITVEFHQNNASAVLWAHGTVWASLSFMDWIKLDHSFPLVYLMSTLGGVGKSSAFNALASSIGLTPEVIGGNKTSESGILDWLSTHNGLGYFLDDFNARGANSLTAQNTWKELLKQIYDAKSVIQHDKFRLILSAVILSSNAELCPHDVPTQQRMLTFYFHPITVNQDSSELEQRYNEVHKLSSCLVPDIIKMRYNGELDTKYIQEIYRLILACCPPSLGPRIAHNMKKPMYMLLLLMAWAQCSDEVVTVHVFGYMDKMITQYNVKCAQKDIWTRFFYFFNKTMESHNRQSSHVYGCLHWSVLHHCLAVLVVAAFVAVLVHLVLKEVV